MQRVSGLCATHEGSGKRSYDPGKCIAARKWEVTLTPSIPMPIHFHLINLLTFAIYDPDSHLGSTLYVYFSEAFFLQALEFLSSAYFPPPLSSGNLTQGLENAGKALSTELHPQPLCLTLI